ncbi:hypothetical protein HanPI659440_Chr12g0458991 [Helianthus annuus]|nr:hypothetical protein HanPI659440_Chr12g0458991 [Helianthus annuus]
MESRHEESIAGERRIEDGMRVIMDHFHLQPPPSWQPQQEDPAGGQQGGAGGALVGFWGLVDTLMMV